MDELKIRDQLILNLNIRIRLNSKYNNCNSDMQILILSLFDFLQRTKIASK